MSSYILNEDGSITEPKAKIQVPLVLPESTCGQIDLSLFASTQPLTPTKEVINVN